MEQLIELSEDAFAALFRPVANHINPNASFDWGAGYGTLFETYGEEVQYVRSQDSSKVWTLCSGDGGDFVISGVHFVNRLGYFITDVAVPEGIDLQVPLPDIDERTIHTVACDLRTRVEAVLGDYDFCASHQALDIEYRLHQMLGAFRMTEQLFKEDGGLQEPSLIRERLAELHDQLTEYEGQRAEDAETDT